MITTLSFAPTKNELFKLLIIRYFKNRWWVFLLVLLVGGFSFFPRNQEEAHDVFSLIPVLVYLILFPSLICLSLWLQLSSKQNKTMYQSRYYEMDFDNVKSFLEDGSSSSIRIGNFHKVERIGENYIMYLTKMQYYILPFSVFKSPDDLKWFEVNVIGKIKMPGFL